MNLWQLWPLAETLVICGESALLFGLLFWCLHVFELQ